MAKTTPSKDTGNRKPRRQFQSVFVVVGVIWALLPMILLSLYFLVRIYHTTQESANQQLSLAAQKSAIEVEQTLLNLMSDFDSLSQQVPVIRAASGSFLSHRAVEQMNHFVDKYPLVNAVFILDKDLFAMEVTPEEGVAIDLAQVTELHPLVRPLSIVDTLRQTAFLKEHPKLAQLNQSSTTGEPGEDKVLLVTSPIVATDSSATRSIRLDGLLVASIPLNRMDDAVSSLEDISNRDMFVSFLLGDEVYFQETPLDPETMVTRTSAIDFTGLNTGEPFYLELAQAKETQLAIVYDAFKASLIIIGLLMLITLAASLLLSRRLARPVQFLHKLTQQLSHGRYEPVENTMEFHEFHEIVDLMNTMSGKIKQQFAELLDIKKGLEQTVAERTRELEKNLHLMNQQSLFTHHLMQLSSELQTLGEPKATLAHTLERLQQYTPGLRSGIILDDGEGRHASTHYGNLDAGERDLIQKHGQRLMNDDGHHFLTASNTLGKRHAYLFHITRFNDRVDGFLIMTGASLSDAERDSIQLLVRVLSAVLQHWKLNRKLEKMANTDSLTNLANRNFFEREFRRELQQLERDPAHLFGIMILDINGLKTINDTYGHEAGDQLITTVARRLTAVCREDDLIARVGGDEFYILMRQANQRSAAALEQRLVLAEQDLYLDLVEADGRPHRHTIHYSLGYATTDNCHAEQLISSADKMMYQRKSAFYAGEQTPSPTPD